MNAPLAADLDHGLVNLRWAQAFVDGLAAAGVGDAVLSPGSRSSPLALALLRQPAIRCSVVVDERSAAFFALGRAKASGRPAALLCTSGSAPAHWLPAVIEAAQAATPLLLLTADRPAELHGWGANQTTDQVRLFGTQVRAAHALEAPHAGLPLAWLARLATRVVGESLFPLPGPVHLNIPFREPLLPGVEAADWPPPAPAAPVPPAAPPQVLADAATIAATAAELSGRRGVIVCGGGSYPPGFAAALTALAAALDCPVFADPLSGLRFGAHARERICVRHESFLRRADFVAAQRPDWLLRCGDFPVARRVQDWLAASAAPTQIVVAASGRWVDPQHAATRHLHGDASAICTALAAAVRAPAPAAWRAAFTAADAHAAALIARQTAAADRGGLWEGELIPELLARLPAGFRFFCGASMAVRDLDTFSGGGDKPLVFFANRGASGIDGNVSTAAGIASDPGAASPTLALVGDLSCAHDLGGLALARGLPLVIVVVNNGGGGIFEYLPAAALPEFDRGWLTPLAADFAHAAATWAIDYRRATTLADFTAALQASIDAAVGAARPCLLEVVVDRAHSVARHRQCWQALAAPPTAPA